MKSRSGTEPASVRFAVPLNAVPATGSLVRSNGASAMAMPSSLHLPSRALGPQPTAPARNLASPATMNTARHPRSPTQSGAYGCPSRDARLHRAGEPSTQKLNLCRRARTAGSGCAQPAGQVSSAAYRTAGTCAGTRRAKLLSVTNNLDDPPCLGQHSARPLSDHATSALSHAVLLALDPVRGRCARFGAEGRCIIMQASRAARWIEGGIAGPMAKRRPLVSRTPTRVWAAADLVSVCV
jgi:hypothetical protein